MVLNFLIELQSIKLFGKKKFAAIKVASSITYFMVTANFAQKKINAWNKEKRLPGQIDPQTNPSLKKDNFDITPWCFHCLQLELEEFWPEIRVAKRRL